MEYKEDKTIKLWSDGLSKITEDNNLAIDLNYLVYTTGTLIDGIKFEKSIPQNIKQQIVDLHHSIYPRP